MGQLEQTRARCRSLRLTWMAQQLPQLLSEAESNEWSYLQCVDHLVDYELKERDQKRIQRHFRLAHFPVEKRLDDFDYRHQTTITKRQVSALLDFNFLDQRQNLVFIGPPGVGKTFIARKLAYHHMGKQNDAQIEMVQFHQSYSYEDFVQGLRLTGDSTEVRNGIFYTFCQQAHAHPKKPFFLIIDEINRGNLSKIFGELLMLIEHDKRSSKFATKLTYALEKEDTFYIPENVYLIGTMNTADRSLAIIDYALRRRFAFINLRPIYDDKFKGFLRGSGMSESFIEHICQSITTINQQIEEDSNLGSGFQIGHSYFCSYQTGQTEEEWFHETLKYEIKPLLEEIWFDNLDKAESVVSKLSR